MLVYFVLSRQQAGQSHGRSGGIYLHFTDVQVVKFTLFEEQA